MCEEPPVKDKIRAEVFSRPSTIAIHSKVWTLHSQFFSITGRCKIILMNSLSFTYFIQENLGYVVINLADVVTNKRINENFHLIDSKNGRIQIELQWRTS